MIDFLIKIQGLCVCNLNLMFLAAGIIPFLSLFLFLILGGNVELSEQIFRVE